MGKNKLSSYVTAAALGITVATALTDASSAKSSFKMAPLPAAHVQLLSKPPLDPDVKFLKDFEVKKDEITAAASSLLRKSDHESLYNQPPSVLRKEYGYTGEITKEYTQKGYLYMSQNIVDSPEGPYLAVLKSFDRKDLEKPDKLLHLFDPQFAMHHYKSYEIKPPLLFAAAMPGVPGMPASLMMLSPSEDPNITVSPVVFGIGQIGVPQTATAYITNSGPSSFSIQQSMYYQTPPPFFPMKNAPAFSYPAFNNAEFSSSGIGTLPPYSVTPITITNVPTIQTNINTYALFIWTEKNGKGVTIPVQSAGINQSQAISSISAPAVVDFVVQSENSSQTFSMVVSDASVANNVVQAGSNDQLKSVPAGSINFGSVAIGSSLTLTAEISVTNGVSAIISSMAWVIGQNYTNYDTLEATNSPFSEKGINLNLAIPDGTTQPCQLTFTPTTLGTLAGQFILYTADGSEKSIKVIAQGISATYVTLGWNPLPNTYLVNVYEGPVGGPYAQIANQVQGTSYTDYTVRIGINEYVVTAVNPSDGLESNFSSPLDYIRTK